MPERAPLACLLVPVCILLAASAPPAFADPPPAEIAALAEQQAWDQVHELASRIEDTGSVLAGADLEVAARAAAELGDIGRWRDRLRALDKERPSAETTATLARLAREYGEVDAAGYGVASVRFSGALTEEGTRAVGWANARLAETGGFRGLLPIGNYLGGMRPFSVSVDGQTAVELLDYEIRKAPTCGPCCHGNCNDGMDLVPLRPPPPNRDGQRE